ncbi:MAG: DMT family transporter, partial [Alphaproteobacteria bacterium]|nr:DMT family transporter [Alphaproteobacteria bacterium]
MAAADEAKRDDRGGGERPSVAIPTLLVLLGGVVYGSVITANKIAIEAGFPFVSYTFWQTFLAGALLLAYGVVRARLPALGLAHLRHYVLTSTFGIVLPVLVLTYVAGRVPAGVLTLIFALAPPIAYLLTFALGRERFRWLSVGGVALGFAGVLMI